MLNELGVDGILLDLLLTSVMSYATKNAEQDVLIWIILTLCPLPHGQCGSRTYSLVEAVQLIMYKATGNGLAKQCGNAFG